MMKFQAILSRDLGGRYVAACSSLPSCQARGASPEDALDALRHAIVEYLAPVMRVCPDLLELFIRPRSARLASPRGTYVSSHSARTPA